MFQTYFPDNNYFVCCICGSWSDDGDPVDQICLCCIEDLYFQNRSIIKK